MKKRGCCENESFSMDTDDNYQPSVHHLDVNAHFYIPFVYAFILQLVPQTDVQLAFRDYSPPPLQQDVLVLFQTFLI